MALRLKAMGQANYRNGFRVTTHPHVLRTPLRWKQSRTIFVNSMSDLFHKKVSFGFISKVFEIVCHTPQHEFQILTKRSQRLVELSSELPWPANVYIGVSVENADYVGRIDDLRQIPAAIRFLSLEPLLGPIPNLNLDGIDWVIVGGESGPHSRPMQAEWVTDIRDQCLTADVPFFFKQWGGVNKKKNGRLLDGKVWEQRPQLQDLSYV